MAATGTDKAPWVPRAHGHGRREGWWAQSLWQCSTRFPTPTAVLRMEQSLPQTKCILSGDPPCRTANSRRTACTSHITRQRPNANHQRRWLTTLCLGARRMTARGRLAAAPRPSCSWSRARWWRSQRAVRCFAVINCCTQGYQRVGCELACSLAVMQLEPCHVMALTTHGGLVPPVCERTPVIRSKANEDRVHGGLKTRSKANSVPRRGCWPLCSWSATQHGISVGASTRDSRIPSS